MGGGGGAAGELYRYITYYSGYAEQEKTRRFQVTKDQEKAEDYRRRLGRYNPGVDGEFTVLAVAALHRGTAPQMRRGGGDWVDPRHCGMEGWVGGWVGV